MEDHRIDERLRELKSLYQFAQLKLHSLERTGEDKFFLPNYELKLAGEHILNASTASNREIALLQIKSAEDHCWRAISDCTVAAVSWSLNRLRKYQEDYRMLPIAEIVPAYGDLLETANQIQIILANKKNDNKNLYYPELERLLPLLDQKINEIEETRAVLNLKLKAQQKKSKQWLIGIALGVSSSIVGSYLNYAIFEKKHGTQDIKTEIANLVQIKASLSQLQTYVGSQQTRLEKIYTDIQDLTDKKQRLEKAVDVNKQAVHELLQHYESTPKRISWVDQLLSFIIGCLSSLFIVFLVGFLKRKKLIDRET